MRRPGTVRLVLVDDSSTVRAVLRRLLSPAVGIEVVGEAADGATAVEVVLRSRPDVVIMDVEMPVMDGFAATERIMAVRPTPILVLSSRANRDHVHTAFEAIRRGAVEVLGKPENTAGWENFSRTLPETVRTLSGVLPSVPQRPRSTAGAPVLLPRRDLRWVAVGASTGGPGALRELLAALPERVPVSILIVQHIAQGFESGMADWLATQLSRDVRLAREGELVPPGAVRLAPAEAHLVLDQVGRTQLDTASPPRRGHRPSVDELLLSCARAHGTRTAGVLLSGMGSDGVEGLAALNEAGGLTLVQDEATSVVFGMPRAALERGAAEISLPPAGIAAALADCWQRERP